MTTTEKGKFYERGIEFYIRQNPKIYFDNTNVEWNVKVKGNSGVLHQIDILLTTGEKLVLVECKNHQKKIGYDVVAKLDSIVQDIPNTSGVIYSVNGFSSDAEQYAKEKNIELISMSIADIIFQGCNLAFKKCLPNLEDPPQKYWVIMEQFGNTTTGSYQLFYGNKIFLFTDKYEAYNNCSERFEVYPVSPEHLRILKGICNQFKKELLVFENKKLIPLYMYEITF